MAVILHFCILPHLHIMHILFRASAVEDGVNLGTLADQCKSFEWPLQCV